MKTLKKTKSAFTVDLTSSDISNVRDVYVCFALAKQEAGLSISNYEFECLINFIIDTTRKSTFNGIFKGHNAAVIEEDGYIRSLDAYPVDEDEPKCPCEECKCEDMPVTQKKPGFFEKIKNFFRKK